MKLFSKDPKDREIEKMRAVIPFMKKIKFFAQRKIEDDDYLLLMENMRHEYMPKGRIVYQEGEFGTDFYIILMGTAAVYIGDSEEISSLSLKRYKPSSVKGYENSNKVLQGKYEFMKMKAGDAFGEMSLMEDKPHNESILCTTTCHFAVLSKKKFEETLYKIESKTRNDWKTFFRHHPVFQDLTLNSLEKLFKLVELKTYSRNQPIYKEGDEVKGFYLIFEGDIKKTKIVENEFKNNLDINKFMMQRKEQNEEIDNTEHSGINHYKSLYRSTVNDTKVNHKFTKEVELCKMGKGLLLGIEDAFLNRSKTKMSVFTTSAICDSVKAY